MGTLEEKRVFGDRTGHREAYVATADGLARVAVSGDRVGEFELVSTIPARDVAGAPREEADGRLVVATADDVLVGPTLEPTGFGPAVAVGDAGGPVAADRAGGLARLEADTWTPLADVPTVRAIDGDLVATTDGVYRLDGRHAGLDDVRDVAAAGPLAGTGTGLYRLGNGWLSEREGATDVVATDGDRAHAVTEDTLVSRDRDGWIAVEVPVQETVVDVAYAEAVCAVTAAGSFLTSADGRTDWHHVPLGLSRPTAMTVV